MNYYSHWQDLSEVRPKVLCLGARLHKGNAEFPPYFLMIYHSQNFHFFFLQLQIETIVLFLLEQQGALASRLSQLGELHDALSQHQDGARISELQEAYRAVGRDLLRLLFFVEINATGLRKILKKFDKRFGYRFTDYYVKTRANHPYSQLRQVFKHVVKCSIQNQSSYTQSF